MVFPALVVHRKNLHLDLALVSRRIAETGFQVGAVFKRHLDDILALSFSCS